VTPPGELPHPRAATKEIGKMPTATNKSNLLRLKTNVLPPELTKLEMDEVAGSLTLYYKNGKYMCQNFFTPPRLGEINWLEGFEKDADVYIRSISHKGPNLYHVRFIGNEPNVRKVCSDPNFFKMLRGLSHTFTQENRVKRMVDTTIDRERWDGIAYLGAKKCYLANQVELDGKNARIDNVIVVGDRLFGLTREGKAVHTQLGPDIVEKENETLRVTYADNINKVGKIDLLACVPNSENSLMVTCKNHVYQCTVWGDIVRFETLDDQVKRVSSIDFNRVRSLLATNDGLFEIEVEEMPNMVRATALPRQISHPELRGSFKWGHYLEDPNILAVHPSIGILAKTETEKVVCF
jgi:hypothetical protein